MQAKTSLTIQQFLADPKRKQRFTAILGMLGSNASGEAANAARAGTAMLRDAGLAWADVTAALNGAPAYSSGQSWKASGPKTSRQTPPFNAQLNTLLDEIEDAIELNDWETSFVTSLRKRRSLSEKQANKLKDIAEAAGVEVSFDLL